jgi:hypothetical protein
MAYTNANWTCVSASLNQGQETVTPFGGSPTILNAPNLFIYGSPTDSVATIGAANYFLAEYASLNVGDWILINGTDASEILVVVTSSSTGVTTAGFAASGTVNTANIVNNAVTFAKFQQVAANSLVGNPTGSLANVEGITLGNGLSFSGTTLQVNPGLANSVMVALTLAQWLGMYATPVQLVAAPGAGLMNIVDNVLINGIYGSAALAGGGVVGAQYGSTAHLAGEAASVTEAAADFIAMAANTMFRLGGGLGTGALTSGAINTAIYLSNATAAFTGGTGDTFSVTVNYRTVSAT